MFILALLFAYQTGHCMLLGCAVCMDAMPSAMLRDFVVWLVVVAIHRATLPCIMIRPRQRFMTVFLSSLTATPS